MADQIRYVGYLRQDMARTVIVNKQDTLQFYIEICSPRPASVPQYVSCFASELEPFGFYDEGETEQERTEALYLWLQDKALTFALDSRKVRGQAIYNALDVCVYTLDLDCADIWQYEAVPVVKELNLSPEALEEAFLKGHPLKGFTPPPRSPNTPLLLIVNGEFRGPFPRVLASGRSHGVKAKGAWVPRRPARADGQKVIDDGEVWFVERDLFHTMALEMELMEEEPAVVAAAPAETRVWHAPPPQPAVAERSFHPAPADPRAPSLPEDGFLAALRRESASQGLYFRDDELLNFHTALKTGALVVLAGLSGTGKSRLVEVYRRALGLVDGTNFLWLSVRPNWNDDADLIGYYDPVNKLYRPGETGLVDLLRQAQERPDEMFLVCFDEMNLARVEHYFAQFLSNLERPEGERMLRLYSPELKGEVKNAERYPAAIPLGRNVLFCGTINMDESTHSFSDKVLDRANIINMDHVDIMQWWRQVQQTPSGSSGGYAPLGPCVSAATWDHWCAPFDARPYEAQVSFLQQLNDALGAAGPDRRFGYRVVRHILLYLHRVPRNRFDTPLILAADAMDQQVAQRILSKVRGSAGDLADLFRPGGSVRTLLERSPVSHFRRSLAEVERKHRELERHDFTA